MSSFFSQLQHIPNTWWHLVKLSGWPRPFENLWSETYRREQEGIQQMNDMLEMASRIRRNFLDGILRSVQPIRPAQKAPRGTSAEDLPEPASLECQLPGG